MESKTFVMSLYYDALHIYSIWGLRSTDNYVVISKLLILWKHCNYVCPRKFVIITKTETSIVWHFRLLVMNILKLNYNALNKLVNDERMTYIPLIKIVKEWKKCRKMYFQSFALSK